MTVKTLKKLLEKYPEDIQIEVIYNCKNKKYSFNEILTEDMIGENEYFGAYVMHIKTLAIKFGEHGLTKGEVK